MDIADQDDFLEYLGVNKRRKRSIAGAAEQLGSDTASIGRSRRATAEAELLRVSINVQDPFENQRMSNSSYSSTC